MSRSQLLGTAATAYGVIGALTVLLQRQHLHDPPGWDLPGAAHSLGPNIWTGRAVFSPDGRFIAFGGTGVGGKADVYVMNADGTDIRPVTRTPEWESSVT